MATTPNQKPVPSEDYVNMRFNAGKFDEFMTSTASSYVDRLGITHLTVKGIQASVADALLPANNLSDVQSAATSRTNLGATTVGSNVFTATTTANARTAILAAVRGANSDITALTGITTAALFTDANAITYSGWSYVNASSTNIPVGAVGRTSMFTNQTDVSISSQLAHNPTSNTLWTRGQTGASTYTTWIPLAKGGTNSDITSLTGLTTPLSTAQGGTGNAAGLAATATALATSRTFSTNLASTTAASFNGTANVTQGVTGTLPLTNGGTGGTTAAAARTSLGAAASAGVTDASSAAAGVVGEFLSATVSGTAVTTSTAINICSISLTAGDWDVSGMVSFNSGGATATIIQGGIGTTSLSLPSFPNRFHLSCSYTSLVQYLPTPSLRINISATTTIYLVAQFTFTGGSSVTADGFIQARRSR